MVRGGATVEPPVRLPRLHAGDMLLGGTTRTHTHSHSHTPGEESWLLLLLLLPLLLLLVPVRQTVLPHTGDEG